MPLKAMGEFALVKEKLESAFELPGQPVKRGTMAHDHDVMMVLSDSAAQLRDAAALQRYPPLLEELATRDGHKLYLAIAHRAWGIAHRLAGEYSEAEACLNQALELFNELETHWQTGRTLVEMAELEMARSNPAGAHDHYSRALESFELLNATPDMERTREAMRSLD